ncbi:MAG TPA: patatin-like phospholipase family protein, partial [Trueperaceae bacterium]
MRIGLVLSGGGARSFAQIGALLALDDYGAEVAAIAATSTGAVLAALYAAGNSARAVQDIVRGIDYTSFLDPNGEGGLIGHRGVEALLAAHAPETFEELSIPLAVPTTDIQNARQLVYRSGPLRPPVCASNAFPGLFVPVAFDGRFLMDGGILNDVPLDLIGTLTTA